MNTTVVYTSIFGRYDKLRMPTVISNNVSYIVITDSNLPGGVKFPWREIRMRKAAFPRLAARREKILYASVTVAKYIIWHDGNVQLLCGVRQLLSYLGDNDIAVIKHPQRSCVYDEAQACKSWGKDDVVVINNQMLRYRQEGFPDNFGLSATFVMVRKNTPRVREFCEAWWEEVKSGSVRDQLTFDYVRWKMDVEISYIPGDMYDGPCYRRFADHGKDSNSNCLVQ